MKVKMEIDMTPEELRRFIGLPDVSELQKEMLGKVREKMAQNLEGFDAATLLKPYLPQHLQSLTALQEQFWKTILQSSQEQTKKDEK